MDRERARALLEQLNRDAVRIAARFQLAYHSIEAERANVKRRYGVCYADGRIRIRLRHAATGDALKYSSLVNTLCHELAHLRHFNHGERFKAFYWKILEYARGEGIYRPGPTGEAVARRAPAPRAAPPPRTPATGAIRRPEQLTLFG